MKEFSRTCTRAPISSTRYCECWFCLNTGPNGACEMCGLLPSPARMQAATESRPNAPEPWRSLVGASK